MGFWQEFKEFSVKGNVMDMAVGIVLGTAFNQIVSSLVNDIIMPPIGYALEGVEFQKLAIVLRRAIDPTTGESVPVVAIRYGAFLTTVIHFAIIALSVFFVVKFMNRLIQKRELEQAS